MSKKSSKSRKAKKARPVVAERLAKKTPSVPVLKSVESALHTQKADEIPVEKLTEQLVTGPVKQVFAASASTEEHRHFTRVALEAEIDLASESHFFSGLSGDVSEGGLFVQTYRDVEVGSDVAVAFSLPNGQVRAQGTVRWRRVASDSSPPGVGIAFGDLSDEDKALIHAFCAAREPLYYDVEHAS